MSPSDDPPPSPPPLTALASLHLLVSATTLPLPLITSILACLSAPNATQSCHLLLDVTERGAHHTDAIEVIKACVESIVPCQSTVVHCNPSTTLQELTPKVDKLSRSFSYGQHRHSSIFNNNPLAATPLPALHILWLHSIADLPTTVQRQLDEQLRHANKSKVAVMVIGTCSAPARRLDKCWLQSFLMDLQVDQQFVADCQHCLHAELAPLHQQIPSSGLMSSAQSKLLQRQHANADVQSYCRDVLIAISQHPAVFSGVSLAQLDTLLHAASVAAVVERGPCGYIQPSDVMTVAEDVLAPQIVLNDEVNLKFCLDNHSAADIKQQPVTARDVVRHVLDMLTAPM